MHSHPQARDSSGKLRPDEGPALPVVLDAGQPVPFYRQIVDQVRGLVLGGRLPPGHPLPSVRALAAQLGTSVITTRRAYEELERARLIVTRQGTGSFVAALSPEERRRQLEDHARARLGEAVQGLSALGLSPDELRQLFEEALEANARVAAALPRGIGRPGGAGEEGS